MHVLQKPSIDIEKAIESLSLSEKVSLLAGSDFWHTTPIPSHGIQAVKCTDGPNGARGSRFFNPVPALCIPCGTGLGATWNPDLIYAAGQLLSRECEAKAAHVWLGPTVNIVRGPLNGRGFESFSEDPLLSGVLAGAIIQGVQSRGTLAALKHFVANDQETDKMAIDVCMSERALREVYLKPFQMAMREGRPRVVMSSYNKLNGHHVSESHKLLDQVLRKEWGFDGLIMSDWYGTYSCAEGLNAGLDIEMPGPSRHRGTQAVLAVSSGKVTPHTIDDRVRSMLRFVNDAASARVAEKETTRDSPEDRRLNRKLAAESVVLLKNSGKLLPVDPSTCGDVAIIGPNAKLAAACGGGSASLRPYYTSSVYQGIRDQLPVEAKVHYEPGVFGHILLPYFTGEHVTDDSGKPGVSIELFNEPHTVEGRKAFDALSIPDTTYQLMDYNHPEKKETFYMSMRANFVPEFDGTYEFGLANYGVGKLFIDDILVIDNETTQEPGGMFFGKGSSEKRGAYEMKAGQSYRLRVEGGSATTSKVVGGSLLPIPGGACRLGGCVKLDPAEGIRRAVDLAKRSKHVFVVAGLNADLEKEGKDRQSMNLPPHVDDLISAVLAARPDAVVVTQAGNPVAMPWRHEAQTILHSWYGGNEAGNAVADVVFGKINPSGKLPVTFQERLEDGPSALSFGSDNGRVYYAEDVFVGHRWFEARKIDVAFPFGHGLSYTTFAISNVQVSPTEVSVDIENTGAMAGAEVLRLYLAFKTTPTGAKSRFIRPVRTLGGFQKIHLAPGEKQSVKLPVTRDGTGVWDEKRDSWCCEAGEYAASVVTGEQALEGVFTVDKDVFWNGL
ncbi:glycoside hydrolase superfamily [Plectosphaerella cucumerina]|uniref:beta-glucosidase n=1 Tax=Plectosphaerella cucumerina TaxID=40658 RepID=A0A8K0WZX8_9PEZI|nr:glycoside hydrolase superfamily [Plectosphaerella cucumerina]